MTDILIKKLVIIGVGLIGGSFALALRQAGLVKHIVGVGRSQKNMGAALKLGVVDSTTTCFATALQDADAVLLAMPVGQTTSIMTQIAPHLEPETILTDAGSTKQDVIKAARSHLASNFENFVPAHPIAGTEQSGVSAAQTDLFRDKPLILTPLDETNPNALEQVTAWWQGCGAQVSQMKADEHDRVLAATSHLPHILAFTLMNHLRNCSGNNPEELLRFAGSGFRDFTRIAGSSPEMWQDICITNRQALLTQIDTYQQALGDIQKMLINADGAALKAAFAEAQEIRKSWLKDKS